MIEKYSSRQIFYVTYLFWYGGAVFVTEKLKPLMENLENLLLKQIANKLKKNNHFFCYFIVPSKKYFLCLL